MASKYLSSGSGTWTAASRTVSAATMSPVFDQSDEDNRTPVTFRIGGSVFCGQVETFVSATSVILSASGILPSVDGSISEILLVDLGLDHTYQDYIDEIKRKVKADEPKFPDDDVKAVLVAAVTDYSHDRPYYITKRIPGNDTNAVALSALGSLWSPGVSQVTGIEYPAGQLPFSVLDANDYRIYDDGSAQDGSNLQIVFLNAIVPGSSEYLTVTFNVPLRLPVSGPQNFPDTDENFENITTLAAAYACFSLATVYATSKDAVISADVVNYNDKSTKYQNLARMYLKKYSRIVFGSEDPPDGSTVAAADAEKEIRPEASFRGRYLWDR